MQNHSPAFLMTLHEVPSLERPTFCGPTAIAAVTGIPVSRVEDAVLKSRDEAAGRGYRTPRERKKGARVKMMWSHEIIPVCRKLGFVAQRVEVVTSTYRRLTEAMQRGEIAGPLMVLVTGHYLALSRWHFVDNRHRKPVDHSRYSCQRDRVQNIWKLTTMSEAT
jgi:hypothetical protein